MLVIVALLACPVFVKQAMVIPHYKKMFEMEQNHSALLRQSRNNTALALGSANQLLKDALDDYRKATSSKIESDSEFRNKIATLELEKAGFKNSGDRLQAENSSLIALYKNAQTRVDQALVKNNTYRKEKEELALSKARVEDHYAESRAAHRKALALATVYRDQAGIAAKELQDAHELIAKYRERVGDLTDVKGTGTVPPIFATVLAVKEGIASINAGSAKGVKPGIRLVVYRRNRFVGYLKIIEVEAQESAGLIVEAVLDAQQGDKVTNEETVSKVTAGG